MLTTAFRFFAALAVAGLIGALVSAVGSNPEDGWMDRVLGPLTVGWKGGVGDHLGYTVLLSMAVVAALLAAIHIAFRDADPESEAEVVHMDSVPLTRAPSGTNFLPLVAAFGVAVLMIGQITNKFVTVAGLALLAVVIGVWMLRAWAERATGDDQINHELYERFIEPFRVPVLSFVVVLGVAIALSRVLLAVSKTGAVVVFIVVGSLILLGASLIAARPAITKNAITITLFIGAIAVIGAGIAAAVVGERDIEHHGEVHDEPMEQEEHGGDGGGSGGQEGGLAPIHVGPGGGDGA
jgi:hypothetical protein